MTSTIFDRLMAKFRSLFHSRLPARVMTLVPSPKLRQRLFLTTVTTFLCVAASAWLSAAVGAQPPEFLVAALADEATAFNRTSSAYEEAPPNLSALAQADHDLGDEAFEEAFVLTPGLRNSGLGPVFNNASCVSCHIRNGRGMPEPGQLLLRISDPLASGAHDNVLIPIEPTAQASPNQSLNPEEPAGVVEAQAANSEPAVLELGNQIQDFGVVGQEPEATVKILWEESAGSYADGTPYRLRSPQFDIALSNGQPLPKHIQVSPRVPPHVYGTGLLEAITEDDIVALADPDDLDGDGISGKPNRVLNVKNNQIELGRFGWKASAPNLLQQSGEAYLNDMGITNPLFPAADGSTEIDEETLVAAAAYAQTLAVPARAKVDDPQIQRGEKLFADASCTACHTATFTTGSHKYPALENQAIHPFTDLLLHDMGPALADNRPDFEANGQEWRTPSLWGVGLAQTVLPYSGYLHDGRARTFAEAILWHGGEAQTAKDTFVDMNQDDRIALVRFLQSL
ncbi:MAG: di-heme oxidoredictase family protein [Cyanobacteria bacterium P01_D01_bin.1]